MACRAVGVGSDAWPLVTAPFPSPPPPPSIKATATHGPCAVSHVLFDGSEDRTHTQR